MPTQGPPTPWWQLPQNTGGRANLSSSAPSGYEYDPVQMRYIPTASSATNQQTELDRRRSHEDTLFGQQQTLFGNLNNAVSGLGGSGSAAGSTWSPPVGSVPGIPSAASSVPDMVQGSGTPGGVTPMGSGSTAKGMGRESYGKWDSSIPDASGAQGAAFAKAKATAGSMGRASADSLKGELAGRGIVGSGTEGRGLVTRLAAATNPLSDINTAHLQDDYQAAMHNQDLHATAAQNEYQGSIAQRGQDIGIQEDNANRDQAARLASYTGAITQRGQNIGVDQGNQSAAVAQRGQTIGANDANTSARVAQRGQDVAQRGQDIQAQQARTDAQLAQQRINQQRQQALMDLYTSALGRTRY